METEVVKFDAELRQIKSMADHTYNIILNVPETDLESVQGIMGWTLDMVSVALIRVKTDRE